MRETEILGSIDEFAATLLLSIYINYCWNPQTQHSFSKYLPQIIITLGPLLLSSRYAIDIKQSKFL